MKKEKTRPLALPHLNSSFHAKTVIINNIVIQDDDADLA